MEKLFLIDAYALIFRFYYAFINRPMRNAEGVNTSAIFGFAKFIGDLVRNERMTYLGVAFDPRGGNFRHQLYPAYKANRDATPEDIVASVPHIKRMLCAMNIPVLEVAGFEADDVIGTLSHKASDAGYSVYMVTPDKDYGQLIRPNVFMYKPRKGGEGYDTVGYDRIKDYYCIEHPEQIIDILALWGDASDNIPGVPGIGEKTACKLITKYGSVENLIANIDELSGKQKENIAASVEQIALSKVLATIDLNVPIDFEPEALRLEDPDYTELRKIYIELGFTSLLRELDRQIVGRGGEVAAKALFGSEGGFGEVATAPVSKHGQGDLFVDLFSQPAPAVAAAASAAAASVAEDVAGGDGSEPEADTIASVPHDYKIVEGDEAIAELVAMLGQCGKVCFDTETTGLSPVSDRLVGVSFAVREHEAYYVPCLSNNGHTMSVLNALRPIFENEAIDKIGQNIKFDMLVLGQYGIKVKGRLWDTMIMHYLLDADARHNMDYLARTLLNYSPVPIETLIGKGAKQLTMDRVATHIVAEYAAEDADVTLRLFNKLHPMLEEGAMVELYEKIEEPLIGTLADIEAAGVKIDVAGLSQLSTVLTAELADLESAIREMAQEPELNINSAKQLGEVLFEKLKVTDKPKKTKTKQYSTDEEYLQFLSDKHPIIELILEYRGLKKLLSTYIDALPQLVNAKTGRIHTSFNQAVTATGRLSSNNPNLQNIPIRDARGREIRRLFVARDAEHVIVSADYSQVELRIMAHLSGDEGLLEAFRHGEDIHTATAAKIFGVPIGDVSKEQRRQAKTANFGIIYGISAFGLSQRLHISRVEAKALIDGYFASYPKVKEYMDTVVTKAGQNGYVETIFGRRRNLKDILSGNATVRGLAERNAINAPIQGSAADIIKLAMIEVRRRLESEKLESKIILQVHDELVLDVPRNEVEAVRRLVTEAMEGAVELAIPLTTELGVGDNWLDAH